MRDPASILASRAGASAPVASRPNLASTRGSRGPAAKSTRPLPSIMSRQDSRSPWPARSVAVTPAN